ncbi:MAG: hypothetical protein ABFR75_05395 [Acidobacteriota bacterium]
MRKIVPVLIFLSLLTGIYSADWKEGVLEKFNKFTDFKLISLYLEENMGRVPEDERSEAVLLLAYSYHIGKDTINEKKWITQMFRGNTKSGISPDSYKFLRGDKILSQERIKIINYLKKWESEYPEVKAEFIEKSFKYYGEKDFLKVMVKTNTTIEFEIENFNAGLNYKKALNKGDNIVMVPIDIFEKRSERTLLNLFFRSNRIIVTKNIVVNKKFEYPENLVFSHKSGYCKIKGKSFKQESRKKVITKVRRYFDKKYFLKKSVVNLAAGLSMYGINGFVIKNKLDSESSSQRSRTLMYSLKGAVQIASIGLSLKGVINFFRSFKKEKLLEMKETKDESAINYNSFLSRSIKAGKEKVIVNMEISDTEEMAK